MKNSLKPALLSMLVLISLSSLCQRSKVKFGDIKTSDFEPSAYAIDSSASGVVLFDIGTIEYEGSNTGGFNIITNRHKRIRLLNRNAFDLATILIPLYASNNEEEKIESLEAVTYNLENGKVVTYKLDKNSIFKDKYDKNHIVKKFTLPNLQEGSIIEVKYRLNSPYALSVDSWEFQGQYPVLWSELSIRIPSIYEYVVLSQGYFPYKINTQEMENVVYQMRDPGSAAGRSELFTYNTTCKNYRWAMENVRPLKNENYITTLGNYVARLDFILSRIIYPNSPIKEVMSTWQQKSEELMKDEDFGAALTKNNGWMKDELQIITQGTTTQLEAAKKIYEYVRKNISCTRNNGIFLSAPLKKALEVKKGTVADINMLLAALLMKQGIECNPVLLSTRDYGRARHEFPMLNKLNYVIAAANIDGKEYLLDASEDKVGFGHLPISCYNGYARIINKDKPYLIELSSDSLKENNITTLFLMNGDNGKMVGSYTAKSGEFGSYMLRERMVKTSKEDYFKKLKKEFSFDVELTNGSIDSLTQYEHPVTVKYDVSFGLDDQMLYINPMLGEAIKENPFKASERSFPVEMPYAMNETFILRMEIPKGYQVEELPKSARVKFNEDEGMFEYMIAKDETAIQLRSTLKLNKATFEPEEYPSLRDFFSYVVKKHSEQIVLKKIKS